MKYVMSALQVYVLIVRIEVTCYAPATAISLARSATVLGTIDSIVNNTVYRVRVLDFSLEKDLQRKSDV